MDDDMFAKVCSFALAAIFFLCSILKQGVLTEAVEESLTDQLGDQFGFDSGLVTFLMLAAVVTIIAKRDIDSHRRSVLVERVPRAY